MRSGDFAISAASSVFRILVYLGMSFRCFYTRDGKGQGLAARKEGEQKGAGNTAFAAFSQETQNRAANDE